ncbi:MAG TPA: hypothetical protein PK466_00625 [Thermotogota bacterium]|nr:hypothetical protein [Thermotogota bacterium]
MEREVLKTKINKSYESEIEKIFSLLSKEDERESNEKIPAICLSGEEGELINLFLENLLERIEENKEKRIKYSSIFNSNDYFEIGASDDVIKIEDVRQLISFSSFKKEFLNYKYIVVKNIEKANVYSLNSLLKLIEEPSEGTVFICTTTSFSALLSTVQSRLFKIQLPVRIKLSDFEGMNTDEFYWISDSSLEILKLASDMDYSEQKTILESLRGREIKELFVDYSLICSGENSLKIENMEFEGKILRKLFSLCIVEKLLFSDSDWVYQELLLDSSDFVKGMESPFTNIFFKELFCTTEKLLYSIYKSENSEFNDLITYTHLTIKLLEKGLTFNFVELLEFLKFLERIKNSVQINCNRELLFYNYLTGIKKILKRK